MPRAMTGATTTMPDRFSLSLPREVRFGRGASAELADLLPAGRRLLVVTSRSTSPVADRLLRGTSVEVARVLVTGEPVLDEVSAEVERVRPASPELVVAVGGGSVIDTGKALAAFLPNRSHAPRDHLEVVGAGHPLTVDPLPVFAVPTTSGTGAEATHNAVLGVPDAARKVSLRDRRLTPQLALVDPELGRDLPHAVAVAAGMDAVVQLVEAAVTPLASPPTRAAAMEGAKVALPALDRLVRGDADDTDRDALAYGALMSGIALANAKLGTVHGFAGVLGGHRDLAHGALCGWFAAPVLAATIEALRAEPTTGWSQGVPVPPASRALAGYTELAYLATGESAPEALPAWFDRLVVSADLPALDLDGLPLDEVVDAVQQASSTRGNPVALSPQTLRGILEGIVVRGS